MRPPTPVPTGYRVLAYFDGVGHLVRAGRHKRLYRICDGHSMSEQFAWPSLVRCPGCSEKAPMKH